MIVEPSTLALFLVAVLALFVTPGPNMAFVLSYSLAHGPRAGFAAAVGIPSATLVRMAMLNSLLNPKALLFFIVFLPQFVNPAHGHVTAQLAILGITLSVVALVYNTLLGMFSGRVGAALQRNPRVAKIQGWFLGAVLAGLALRLLLLDRPVR